MREQVSYIYKQSGTEMSTMGTNARNMLREQEATKYTPAYTMCLDMVLRDAGTSVVQTAHEGAPSQGESGATMYNVRPRPPERRAEARRTYA